MHRFQLFSLIIFWASISNCSHPISPKPENPFKNINLQILSDSTLAITWQGEFESEALLSLDRNVGAGADCQAEISLSQCRGIVDAIADHCDDVAGVLQPADHAGLVSGKYVGDHVHRVDADLGRAGLDQVGDLGDRELLGELVEDPVFATIGGVLGGQLDTAERVLDVEVAARLTTGAIDRQRVADDRLDAEAVQHLSLLHI